MPRSHVANHLKNTKLLECLRKGRPSDPCVASQADRLCVQVLFPSLESTITPHLTDTPSEGLNELADVHGVLSFWLNDHTVILTT